MSHAPDDATDARMKAIASARAVLEARRIAISRELAAIPPPVPACDVDFNRLLDERGKVVDALQHLKRLADAGADITDIAAFCREIARTDAIQPWVER